MPSFEAFADPFGAQEKKLWRSVEPGTFETPTPRQQVPMEILFQDPRRIVVTKP